MAGRTEFSVQQVLSMCFVASTQSIAVSTNRTTGSGGRTERSAQEVLNLSFDKNNKRINVG